MAKKLFISVPMRGRTKEEFEKDRELIAEKVKSMYNDIEVIDSVIKDFDPNKNIPVHYLSVSIEFLSQADMAAFADGWKEARGCVTEHDICERYNIPIIID